jgi:anti-sigma factor RsiW
MPPKFEHVDVSISGYLDGELDLETSRRVVEHCAECARCRRELAEMRKLVAILSVAFGPQPVALRDSGRD